jgi:hypothetical protein
MAAPPPIRARIRDVVTRLRQTQDRSSLRSDAIALMADVDRTLATDRRTVVIVVPVNRRGDETTRAARLSDV